MRRAKRLFGLTLGFLLTASATVPAAQQVGVRWHEDLQAAKVLAKQTGRLVLVHFWTPSCAPCESLEQNVLSQPSVAAALEARFVPVKLNANENPATAEGFGITRVPTDVILTPDGQVVGNLISPPTPAAYIAELTQVANRAQPVAQPLAHGLPAAPEPPPLNAAYAALPVGSNTPPAIAPSGEAHLDRYASAAPASVQRDVSPGPATPGQPAGGNFTAPPLARAAQQQEQPAVTPIMPTTEDVPPPAQSRAISRQPTADSEQQTAAAPPQPTAPGAAPDPGLLPAGAPPLGFEGYCPVSMRNHWKWVAGDPRWGVIHRGRTYWFAGETEQQQFWSDPDRYSPALSGIDPVLAIDHQQQVPGRREHSIDYDNQFYMFASEATLSQFTANPERYAANVRQAMGIRRGRLVR